jgi:hypothetical protein
MMYGMKEQKLTIRVSQEVLQGAKQYAEEHSTTLTRLVTTYLQGLEMVNDPLESAPITRSLAGALPPDMSPEEYRDLLEEKYLGPPV